MSDSVLTMGEFYPLGDSFNFRALPDAGPMTVEEAMRAQRNLRGMWEGSPRRAPKRGEWYFSGDPIVTWRAPNDFIPGRMDYHIATIVQVRVETHVDTIILRELT